MPFALSDVKESKKGLVSRGNFLSSAYQMRVLVCGHRSPSAQGLGAVLEGLGWEVEFFSRGPEGREKNQILGDVCAMAENENLSNHYDAVVNFIVLKGEGVEENLHFAQALIRFCNRADVRCLVHISSVSVFPSDVPVIDESCPMVPPGLVRGSYSTLKTEVDRRLIQADKRFRLVLLRPGLILSPAMTPPRAGIVKRLPGGLDVLLGDRRTSLPIVRREDVHEAIGRILQNPETEGVLLAVSRRQTTKYEYAKQMLGVKPVPLPRRITLALAQVMKGLGVFSGKQLVQVQGLFRENRFDATATERRLDMVFE